MENEIYFIVNPQAKNGYGMKIWKKVEAELIRRRFPYHIFFTEYRGHAVEIARSIGANSLGVKKLIIAIGGDGTIHEVVNGLVGFQNIEVGFIPGGSGNDFSRGYFIPKDWRKALAHVLDISAGKARKIDLGYRKQGDEVRYFVNNLGAGFDALVAQEANQSKLKPFFNRMSLGKLVYVAILVKKLFTFKATSLELQVDESGYKFDNVWFVTVSNQPYFGGGMKISPAATPFDGTLNITVVHNLSKLKLLAVFISVFWGGHTRFKEVKTFSGKNVLFKTSSPQPVHLDGELYGTTPVRVQVVPQAISVVTGDELS